MPLYASSEEWTHYTTLLLRARPTTTRIVTKYTIPALPSLSSVKATRSRRASSRARSSTEDASASEPKPPAEYAKEKPTIGYLELRAYDPESGVCLKYRTEKAAEVGRLIGGLGRMGRVMAALPEVEEKAGEKEDVVMGEAEDEGKKEEVKTAAGQAQTSGGKGKKKKGKR
ncbi:hypothetical protein CAC42_3012 [Sphaceloma murrayae]|uniref:SRP9 domain-containing protein n=1 Tax=Sphaceloma murrayae TaxID=2082308 RepID=A0A2K1QRA0_9PEZI|nr:hypothetical protein CAC42_3012 [Sphaceloma murrayae]